MLTVTDRGGQVFGLAPTAEEVVTDYAGAVVKSYKQLPVCFFQQNTKFRDELRPRFGLMRVKEFIMMDAYSFHETEESLAETYEAMRVAYLRAFKRLGLEAFAVEADTGAIGGSGSHEFMVAADVGEDAIIYCPESGYAANVERAQGGIAAAPAWRAPATATLMPTPKVGSIADVMGFLNANGFADVKPEHGLKCVLFVAKTAAAEHTVAAFVRGDRDVNEVKLTNTLTRLLGDQGPVLALRPMQPDEVRAATGAEPGFAGPGAGLKVAVAVCDERLKAAGPLIAGANRTDHHLVGFVVARDTQVALEYDDLTTARAGDACPRSGQPLQMRRGIEVGHIFKLGTKYSAAMKAEFTGRDQKLHPFIMGCYGIGSTRVIAAAVEQHHDDNGITWPMAIAPWQCVVMPVGKPGDAAVEAAARQVYDGLLALGVEAVLDDRDLKPGVKFKDWDLTGIPLRVVCGRGVANGLVEFKARGDAQPADVPLAEAATMVAARVREALAASQAAADAVR
jgi:prolyl-tRNA synthetase